MSAPATTTTGDLTEHLLTTSVWTDADVAAAGIPLVDVPMVSVGGGIGSFIMSDILRVSGLPASSLAVLSPLDYPWQTYEYLTRASQVPATERLRSDSASSPDNIWGFPSLAMRESWKDKTLKPMWNVATEPILSNYWTPRAGTVFAGLQREADRIGYWAMVRRGLVRIVRRRAGGGYFTILTPPEGTTPTKRIAFRSQYVHIAIGYPGLKFLDDLQEFRARHPESPRVVNAYEVHEHVYDELASRPGTVLLRGAGIVASRVLQRLIDDRDRLGLQTRIAHLFRTYYDAPHGPSVFMRRRGADGWAYQGFNYPKSAWGGQLWKKMRDLEGAERAALYDTIGGTNTPVRKDWQEQLARGRAQGWYRAFVGGTQKVDLSDNGQSVVTTYADRNGAVGTLEAQYVIDCTGLEADITEHRLLADLLAHSGAGRNPKGRLDVERTFEVRGTASPPGAMYAVGSMTLGGYFPGVDTFLGLQLAGMEIQRDLARRGFVPRLTPSRSMGQWLKWTRGKAI